MPDEKKKKETDRGVPVLQQSNSVHIHNQPGTPDGKSARTAIITALIGAIAVISVPIVSYLVNRPPVQVGAPPPIASSELSADDNSAAYTFTNVTYTDRHLVTGKVAGIQNVSEYRVMLFILVDQDGLCQWYVKPSLKDQISEIYDDFTFTIRAYTGDVNRDQDQDALEYALFLLPASFAGISEEYMFDVVEESALAKYTRIIAR